ELITSICFSSLDTRVCAESCEAVTVSPPLVFTTRSSLTVLPIALSVSFISLCMFTSERSSEGGVLSCVEARVDISFSSSSIAASRYPNRSACFSIAVTSTRTASAGSVCCEPCDGCAELITFSIALLIVDLLLCFPELLDAHQHFLVRSEERRVGS